MNKSLLDTDIFSEVMKGVDPHVVQKARAYLAVFGRYTVSAATVMESSKGLHKQRSSKKLKQFLSHLSAAEVLPFEQNSAEVAGRILWIKCDKVRSQASLLTFSRFIRLYS